MGFAPSFRLPSFDELDLSDRLDVLRLLLEALALADLEWLRKHPEVPLLYASNVHYEREPIGRDEWQDVPDTLARGSGDCEDFAAWRVAELRLRGDRARFFLRRFEEMLPTGETIIDFHIQVQHSDGALEDPAELLGMNQRR